MEQGEEETVEALGEGEARIRRTGILNLLGVG